MPTKRELQETVDRQREQIDRGKETIRRKNARYNETIDRINLTFPAGTKEQIRKAADAAGMSINAYCRDTILKSLNK